MRDSSRTPTRTRRRMRALPSNRRLGSFSSRVKSWLPQISSWSPSPVTFRKQSVCVTGVVKSVGAYRAARRILDRVSWTRQTSRLLRRPYSPTSFNSESLGHVNDVKQRQALISGQLTNEQTRKLEKEVSIFLYVLAKEVHTTSGDLNRFVGIRISRSVSGKSYLVGLQNY